MLPAAAGGWAAGIGLSAVTGLGVLGPSQRIASATTTPVELSVSVTPWSLPGSNWKLPSDCHTPPLACWFSMTGWVPSSDATQYVALVARSGPLIQRAKTSYCPALRLDGNGQNTVAPPGPRARNR